MIQNPFILAGLFTALVFFLQWARGQRAFRWMFHPMPVPFWCYFIPMLASSAGIIPQQSSLYPFLSKYALPLCLALLLITVDLKALASLGRMALGVMAFAIAGIMTGAVVSFGIFHNSLPADSWRAVGALSGSWIGGSANMLALKESLAVPDAVFAPVAVVDPVLAYGWMAMLIFLAGFQNSFDNRMGAQEIVTPDVNEAGQTGAFGVAIAVCILLAAVSLAAGEFLPPIGTFVTAATWRVLTVTTLSLCVSLGRRFRAQTERLEKIGTTILYILLASVGAQGSLAAIREAPLFLALGGSWLVIHGMFLIAAAKVFRAPLFLLATASQACVGGPVSAPMVAAVYRPSLAAVGLLLAILGNVLGTYLGFAVAAICRWISK